MVYTGKPSTGCKTCRDRRIKCDEGRPSCNRCIKSKRVCLGYRNASNVRIRDETQKTKERSTGKPRDSLLILSSSTKAPVACTDSSVITFSPSRDVANEALYYLFDLMATPRHVGGQGPLLALPQIYRNASPDSPIFPVTSAVALLFFSRFFRSSDHKIIAERSFCEAISRLRRAIADPVAVRRDDTLMAMNLCGTWEAFRANIESKTTWGEHARGRYAVVKLRGAEMQKSRTSQILLRAAISDLVQTKLYQRLPVELPFDITCEGPEHSITGQQPPSHSLILIGIEIASLRAQGWILKTASMTSETAQKILKLLQNARAIDQDLLDWQLKLPQAWEYEEIKYTECQDEDLMDSFYYPGPAYAYYDFTTASSYNMWRAFRILVRVIIFNCLERLVPPSRYGCCREFQDTLAILQELVNGICFSLPFQLGLEDPICRYAESLSPMVEADVVQKTPEKLAEPSMFVRPTPDAHRKLTEQFAGFSVYFPLFMAHDCPMMPEKQRRWIKRKYIEMGKRFHLNQVVAAGNAFMSDDYSHRSINVVDYAPPPFEPFEIDDPLDRFSRTRRRSLVPRYQS